METFAIEQFLGRLTKRTEVTINPGYAKIANDIDWRGSKGSLKGLGAHEKVWAIAEAITSMGFYNGFPVGVGAEHFYWKSTAYHIGGGESTTGWTSTALFAQIAGKLIGVNGSKAVKFDGTTLYELGVTVPTNGSFAAAGSGSGSFTVGDWDYKVTFVNSDGFESNPGAAITATSQGASKANCSLTAIPTGSALEGVASRRIYRTTTGGATFYLLATISDNTTTTYTDTTVDGSLGTSTPPSTHDKLTTEAEVIERVGDRLFAAGGTTYPRRLWFSLPDPYYEGWPSTYYDDLPYNIVTIKRVGEALLVLTEYTVHVFENLDNVSYMYMRDLGDVPSDSIRARCTYQDYVYWKGPLGVFRTSGMAIEEVSAEVQDLLPTTSNYSDMTMDSYGILYLLLNSLSFSSEYGKDVDLTYGTKTVEYSAEVGKTVRTVSVDDTYTFTSEYGKIVSLGGGVENTGSMIMATPRDDQVLWSTVSDAVSCITHEPTKRTVYIGQSDGIYRAFTGTEGTWTWQSVYSNFGLPTLWKRVDKIRLTVNGTVTLTLYGDDDVELHSVSLVTTEETSQLVDIPPASWAYKFSIKLEGAAGSEVVPPAVYFYEVEKV